MEPEDMEEAALFRGVAMLYDLDELFEVSQKENHSGHGNQDAGDLVYRAVHDQQATNEYSRRASTRSNGMSSHQQLILDEDIGIRFNYQPADPQVIDIN